MLAGRQLLTPESVPGTSFKSAHLLLPGLAIGGYACPAVFKGDDNHFVYLTGPRPPPIFVTGPSALLHRTAVAEWHSHARGSRHLSSWRVA